MGFLGILGLLAANAKSSMGPIKAKAKIVKAKTTTLIAINAEFI